MLIVQSCLRDIQCHHEGGFFILPFGYAKPMSVNIKTLTALLFTGFFLQTAVLSNVHVSPEVMKLSPFYSPSSQIQQPAFSNLASVSTPARH
jgi:hypothetical protein